MRKYFLLLSFFVFVLSTKALDQSENILTLDSKKGLISDVVFCGLQSKFTNLYWFATNNGLISYDGCNFENYEERNPFFGLTTLKVIEDQVGRIWFYTSGGNIVVYDGYYFKEINLRKDILLKLSRGYIADFRETAKGIFFIVCDFTNKKEHYLIQITTINNNYYSSIIPMDIESHDNILIYWLDMCPILIVDLKQLIEYYRISENFNFFYNNNCIIGISQDSLYYKYNSSATIQNVEVRKDKIIISSYDGVTILNMKFETLLTRKNFQMVTSCFYDQYENLIVTTLRTGVKVETNIPLPQPIISNLDGVSNIKYHDQFIYYSDKLFNLFRIKTSSQKIEPIHENSEKNFSDSKIYYWRSLFFNKHEFIYSGGRFHASKVYYIPFQLYNYNGTQLYISTGYADVKLVDSSGTNIKTLFYGRRVYDAKIDANGTLWVATNSGLYKGQISTTPSWTIKHFDVFFSGDLTERIDIINGKIFVLINKRKIGLVNNSLAQDDVFSGTAISNKLISNYKFINDQAIIISANNGLGYANISTSTPRFEIKNINFSNFFPLFNENKIVDFDVEGNTVYFATDEGIYSLDLNYWKSHVPSTKCYIENINTGKRVINSIALNSGSSFEFSNEENTLDFNIINSYFNKSPADGLFRYFLVYNNDTLGTQYSHLSGIKFYNLKYGNYKLVVQGKNAFGQWGPKTSLSFYINPKFTETNKFIFLITALVLGIILFFVYLILANKNRMALNEKLELENENFQLQLLKSQMNPHFLFNSLNSLKGLIYLNRKDLALKYTDRLSIFLRSILSLNNELLAKIEDEIAVIEHYLEVERIRLGFAIELNINFSSELKQYLIPSNILQPLIENSIKHGMSKERETLAIWVDIKKNSGYIEFNISDNGIGIKDTVKNTSFSLKAIEKRVDKFNNGKINKGLELKNIIINNEVKGAIIIIKLLIYENPNS